MGRLPANTSCTRSVASWRRAGSTRPSGDVTALRTSIFVVGFVRGATGRSVGPNDALGASQDHATMLRARLEHRGVRGIRCAEGAGNGVEQREVQSAHQVAVLGDEMVERAVPHADLVFAGAGRVAPPYE